VKIIATARSSDWKHLVLHLEAAQRADRLPTTEGEMIPKIIVEPGSGEAACRKKRGAFVKETKRSADRVSCRLPFRKTAGLPENAPDLSQL